MSVNGSQPHLRIFDMTDRELLAILSEMEPDDEGWVDAGDIALEIWPRRAAGADGKHCTQSVGRRLGFMRTRAGLVEKHEKVPRLWKLSERGERFLDARLSAAQLRSLGATDEHQLVEVLGVVGERYGDLSNESAWILRREWQHREQARRRR